MIASLQRTYEGYTCNAIDAAGSADLSLRGDRLRCILSTSGEPTLMKGMRICLLKRVLPIRHRYGFGLFSVLLSNLHNYAASRIPKTSSPPISPCMLL